MSENKKIIFEMLRKVAIAKGQDITSERLRIYAEYLHAHDLNRVLNAIEILFVESRFFPDISDILKTMQPEENPDDLANDMAGKILQVNREVGYMQSQLAREMLGDQAWYAVQRFGGWESISLTETKNLPTVRAQLRDICKATIRRGIHEHRLDQLEGPTGLKKLNYDDFKKLS